MILSQDPPAPNDISDYNKKQKLNKNSLDKSGLHVWFNGESKLQVFYRAKREEETPSDNKGSCKIDFTKGAVNFMISYDDKKVTISYHYEEDH